MHNAVFASHVKLDFDTAVVTGATGFVGAALVQALLARGTRLRVLTHRVTLPSKHTALSEHQGDITDAASLRGLARGSQVLFHLAGCAEATARADAELVQGQLQRNLAGTQNVFQEAVAAGVQRFVFVSSVKAMGEDPERCLDETQPARPNDVYGRIKLETENWLFDQRALDTTVVRPALVYGAGVKGNLAAMLRAVDRRLFPPLPETGNVRSMVGLADLTEALLCAAQMPQAVGKAYVITDGEAYSTRRIYCAMATALGRAVPGFSIPPRLLRGLGFIGDGLEALSGRNIPINRRTVARLLESACYRSVCAEADLDYHPRQTLEDVLPAMVAVYRGGSA